jgi:hypothetical protein
MRFIYGAYISYLMFWCGCPDLDSPGNVKKVTSVSSAAPAVEGTRQRAMYVNADNATKAHLLRYTLNELQQSWGSELPPGRRTENISQPDRRWQHASNVR